MTEPCESFGTGVSYLRLGFYNNKFREKIRGMWFVNEHKKASISKSRPFYQRKAKIESVEEIFYSKLSDILLTTELITSLLS